MSSVHSSHSELDPAASRRTSPVRAAGLVLVLFVLRVPLLDHPTPVDVDEQSFMAALGFPAQYPVHHPGYPLWVGMGTVLHAAGLEPYTAYQAWSLAASIVGPLLLYVGLRWVLADSLAWWLALGFGVNPLVWFQGTTALNYMAGGTTGLVVVGLCYRAVARRRSATMYWAATVLAIGISIRADLLIYVGPMLAYVAWRFRWRRGLGAMIILAAGIVAFLAVTSHLYGRADPTRVRPELGHTIDVVLGTSAYRLGLVNGLLRNLVKIGVNLGWDFGVAVLLLPPAAWWIVRDRRRRPSRSRVTARPPAATKVWHGRPARDPTGETPVPQVPSRDAKIPIVSNAARPPAAAAVCGTGVPPVPPPQGGQSHGGLGDGSNWPGGVATILLLWVVPISLFLALMHVVQGYFVLSVAAGYCMIGLALQGGLGRRAGARVAAVIAVCSMAQFVLYPWSPDSVGFKRRLDAKIAFQSASGLRQIDRRPEIHEPGDYWRTEAHGE
ncbi:MAG: hypothetical protein JXQ75_09340 [Phycisphaerae bacterium]|nr:hypothetical protein [Phycisphaerae bacterium]